MDHSRRPYGVRLFITDQQPHRRCEHDVLDTVHHSAPTEPIKGSPSDLELTRIFAAAKDGLKYVQTVVRILSKVLQDGLRGDELVVEVAEAAMSHMLTSYAMQAEAGIYQLVRIAVVRAGVNCAPSHFQALRNCPVGINIIHAISRSERTSQILAEYHLIQDTIQTVLPSLTTQPSRAVATVDPPYILTTHVITEVPTTSHIALRACQHGTGGKEQTDEAKKFVRSAAPAIQETGIAVNDNTGHASAHPPLHLSSSLLVDEVRETPLHTGAGLAVSGNCGSNGGLR